MRNVTFLASAIVLMAGLTARAAEITAEQASAAVQAWVDEGSALGRRFGTVTTSRTLSTSSGARLHVVRFAEGGFAVTPADDRIDPVIAFLPSGDELVQDGANPLWVLLSGDIEARARAVGMSSESSGGGRAVLLAAAPNDAVARAQARWAALLGKAVSQKAGTVLLGATPATPADIRVDPFVESHWSQSTHNNYEIGHGDNCYNYYTPNHYVCGCVATAGAQLMRYWQWPTASVMAKTFKCAVNGTPANYTMQGGTYAWSNMPLVPANGVTETQCQAIGKLTYDIGVSVGMNWRSGGSGANLFALVPRLKDTFGYTNAVGAVYLDGSYPYSLDELKKAVIPNCDAHAPVAMSISGAGGHAVVVDGYGYSGTDFYIHANFGWAGLDDAWYLPPDISDYDTIDGFVFNVFPQTTGSILSGRVLDAGGVPIAGASVSLKRGSSTVATTTTDAKGIYAFIAAADHYIVTAASGGFSADLGVTLATTQGTSLTDAGGWYDDSAASIGNSYGNDIALTGVAAVTPPVFSPESCLFYPSTNVAITCADSDAVIRYTKDGSDPDSTSPIYSGPIYVDDTVTIKARAFANGKNPSAVVGATYTYDAAAGAPKGDYFNDPIKISGASGTRVIDDNTDYTVEDGEPLHTLQGGGYYPQYRTVWYQWTAPGSGTMIFSTSSTGGGYLLPTFIAIYTGDTLASATRLSFADTYEPTYVTQLSLTVEQGTTYRIVGMQGYDMAANFTLSWEGDLTVQQTETSATPVPVPYAWLDAYYPNASATAASYETLALSDSDGDGFAAWAEYAANSDPTNASSRLACGIAIGADGVPVITVDPPTARDGFPRVLQGKANLTDAWIDLSEPSKAHHFYRVRINLGD